MTPLDAYDLTLEKINELKESDIIVTIRPSESQADPDTVKQFRGPERIPPHKWVHVSLNYSDKGQENKIYETANYLGLAGIQFDTGGWDGYRDWELDWSFKYTGKEDEGHRDAREQVEEIIEKISKKKNK